MCQPVTKGLWLTQWGSGERKVGFLACKAILVPRRCCVGAHEVPWTEGRLGQADPQGGMGWGWRGLGWSLLQHPDLEGGPFLTCDVVDLSWPRPLAGPALWQAPMMWGGHVAKERD